MYAQTNLSTKMALKGDADYIVLYTIGGPKWRLPNDRPVVVVEITLFRI